MDWQRRDSMARRQLGNVTRRQLHAAGWSTATIRRHVIRGDLVQVAPSTYRVAATPDGPEARVMAACLETGGVASHRTAAWLHGLLAPPPVIEVVVARAGAAAGGALAVAGKTVVRHSTTSLPKADQASVGPIPVTSVARTALMLGSLVPGVISQAQLEQVVARATEQRLATMPWLWWLLEHRRCRGRGGVLALESALAAVDGLGPTESWLEREYLRLVREAGLPIPATQRVMRRTGRFVARVDFVFDAERVVVEVLGYRFHRTKEQIDADTRRANELQLIGFAVFQFTYDQIVRSPGQVIAVTRAALATGCA